MGSFLFLLKPKTTAEFQKRTDGVIVVLGYRMQGDRPHPCLVERLTHAVRLVQLGFGNRILVSGGCHDDGASESGYMKKFLLRELGHRAGIQIYRENLSRTTKENAEYSCSLLHHLYPAPPYVVLVTHKAHMERAVQHFRTFCPNLHSVTTATPPPSSEPKEIKMMNESFLNS